MSDPGSEEFDFDAEFAKAFGPKKPVRSVLVTPVAQAAKLAEVCTLAGVVAHVVPVKGLGSVLVTADPGDGAQAVETLSTVLRGMEVVLLTVGEDSIEGQTWRDGTRQEDPKPGLLLSLWPDTVQELVLGKLDPEQAAGAAMGGEGSRLGSIWKLLRNRDGKGDPPADDPPSSGPS